MNKVPGSLLVLPLLIITCFSNCNSSKKMNTGTDTLPAFYKVGHRGTRGLMPENSIPAMTKAIELGANVIEFDVHISKDGKIVVYHDPTINPDYTTFPDGRTVSRADRVNYRIYQMNYADIRQLDIGSKPYDAYPRQQKMKTHIPLMSELIDSVQRFTRAKGLPDVYFLLEIKANANTDGTEQPDPEAYSDLILEDLKKWNLGKHLIIQSFDMRQLQVIHRKRPDIILGFLTDNRSATVQQNLDQLGFKPLFYNPHYKMVTPELLKQCHDLGMKVVPWTINTKPEMDSLIAMGVDGIITDFPDFF